MQLDDKSNKRVRLNPSGVESHNFTISFLLYFLQHIWLIWELVKSLFSFHFLLPASSSDLRSASDETDESLSKKGISDKSTLEVEITSDVQVILRVKMFNLAPGALAWGS